MHLTRLADMIDAGALTSRLGPVLTLAEAPLAHEMLAGSRSRGKGKIVRDLQR
jgi:NADPH:quinone reductase-like Zn-dependent oxidoreductase